MFINFFTLTNFIRLPLWLIIYPNLILSYSHVWRSILYIVFSWWAESAQKTKQNKSTELCEKFLFHINRSAGFHLHFSYICNDIFLRHMSGWNFPIYLTAYIKINCSGTIAGYKRTLRFNYILHFRPGVLDKKFFKFNFEWFCHTNIHKKKQWQAIFICLKWNLIIRPIVVFVRW